jgi:hypothetical protein
MIVLEVFVLVIGHDGRRKGTKPLAVLDARVENILHVGQAGMGDDRAIAERARAPLHAPLKPADHIAGRDLLGTFFEQCSAFQLAA